MKTEEEKKKKTHILHEKKKKGLSKSVETKQRKLF